MDFSNVKSITIPEGTVKQIQDSNGNIIWKGTVSVSYVINTGVASITIVGNDGVTYVNGATTSGSVDISPGVTITCSATVETGYNTISNTTKVLDNDYVYSPTTSKKTFTITLDSVYGHWEKNSITVTKIENVPYGTTITKSGQTITVNGFGTYNFVINSDTAEYDYTFDSITIPSSTVTSNMSITGTATVTTRSYSLTFHNDSSKLVTVYFRIGSGAWSTYNVSGGGSKSVSTTYNNSISVYFKYGDATSSTITRTMTSDQTVYGDCAYHYASFTDTQNISYCAITYEQQTPVGAGVWSNNYRGGDVFSRPGNATHVKMTWYGTEYIAPIPSGLGGSMYDYWDHFDPYTAYSTCVNDSNQQIAWWAQDTSDDDDSYLDAEVILVGKGSWNDYQHFSTLQYGIYNAAYYEVWWN